MTSRTPQLRTVAEAADQLGMSKPKLYALMESGDIAFIKLPPYTKQAGRRIEQTEIDAFIQRNRSAVSPA